MSVVFEWISSAVEAITALTGYGESPKAAISESPKDLEARYYSQAWVHCRYQHSDIATAISMSYFGDPLPNQLTGEISEFAGPTHVNLEKWAALVKSEDGFNVRWQNEMEGLEFWDLGSAGTIDLAKRLLCLPKAVPTLHSLSLGGNGIGPEGVSALADALAEGAAPEIKGLYLAGNRIGAKGAKALASKIRVGAAPKLEDLALSANGIGPAIPASRAYESWGTPNAIGDPDAGTTGVKALADVLFLSGAGPQNLRSLDLSYNTLGAEGTQVLADALIQGANGVRVEVLHLYGNNIGPEGCTALADALAHGAVPRLLGLNLNDNNVGDEGCEALADALKRGACPLLETLHVLGKNEVSYRGSAALRNAKRELDLDLLLYV